MLFSDLRQLKKDLEIDPANTAEDVRLTFFLETVTSWIEEFCGRQFAYKQRTEHLAGTGTQKLVLKWRPVFSTPAIQCWIDGHGAYGQATDPFPADTQLTYGTDFALKIDQEDGISSRSGILVRRNAYWPLRRVRTPGYLAPFYDDPLGNIKVTYYGGYTVDSLPAVFRQATNLLVARLRYLLPLGMVLGSESYEERSISLVQNHKNNLMGEVGPLLVYYRNWKW